ncbi:hypothetical protein BaRGS_00021594 [Batillaria attramentaria]|uniref:Uncharacterized protein n=1 Tax=Batillaria attramentaria TaxID=370345 RepID=A0ABD0KIS9_9CAEN
MKSKDASLGKGQSRKQDAAKYTTSLAVVTSSRRLESGRWGAVTEAQVAVLTKPIGLARHAVPLHASVRSVQIWNAGS